MHFWIDKRSQTCGFGRARVAASLSNSGGMGLGFGHPPRRMGGKPLVAPIHRLQSSECSRPHIYNSSNNNSSNSSNSGNNPTGNNRTRMNHMPLTHQQHPVQNSVQPNHSTNLQRNNVVNQECNIPVPLPNIYGGPSHVQDLEQGSLGIGSIPTRPNLTGVSSAPINGVMVEPAESQLLPSHLKCGMWASLVLASVFVAGAKFYFDHQGTGLEVLIFCAFSATFFLAACTVSLCRLPRDFATSPSASLDGHNRGLDGQIHSTANRTASGQHQLFGQDSDQANETIISLHGGTTTAPPPPYHIAILLPENKKELKPDETPPPSYDKVLI